MSWRNMRHGVGIALLGTLLSTSVLAHESLTDALIDAYRNSPDLEQNRAALRSTDEGVVQARAAKLPQVNAGVSASAATDTINDDIFDSYRAAITASLLLWDGGATNAAIKSAAALIDASRANLKSVEQTVLLDAVTAYVDVRRDERFVSLARNNVDVITRQLEAAEDRFDVGEVTRTDVSQAQSRLASARSNLARNVGALEASRQSFLVAVGRKPGPLASPPALPKLPSSLSDAERIAIQNHPTIEAAQHNIRSAELDVERARAANKGTVDVSGSVSYDLNQPTDGDDRASANVSLGYDVPLYTGGRTESLIRQASGVLEQRQAQLQDAARGIRQAVALAWSQLDVARASIRASRQEIRAAQIALEGVQEEARLGARTTLDVLDAEQDVLDAQSNLAAAERDEYVAAYNLISAIGLLSVDHLGLGIETYDPDVNFHQVTNSPATASKEGTVLDRISNRWANN